MKYVDFLKKYCKEENFWKRTGYVEDIGLPWCIRLKIWLLERKGHLVRVTLDYHYHSVDEVKCKSSAKGFGFVRIFMYKLEREKEGLELEESSELV